MSDSKSKAHKIALLDYGAAKMCCHRLKCGLENTDETVDSSLDFIPLVCESSELNLKFEDFATRRLSRYLGFSQLPWVAVVRSEKHSLEENFQGLRSKAAEVEH
jgi:hypothetical protein